MLKSCAYNLGLVMRRCYGMGKPRSGGLAAGLLLALGTLGAAASWEWGLVAGISNGRYGVRS